MKRITIRELHMRTGRWVREAASEDQIIVTDRGEPIAVLKPCRRSDIARSFRDRRETDAFSRLPMIDGDTSHYISDDRDRS